MPRPKTDPIADPALRTAGVDEAGRGPLAGAVVCAAVILDPAKPIDGLKDSKLLKAPQREALRELILERALAYSIIEVSAAEIDQINIFQATMQGMSRALFALPIAPEMALIDGNKLPQHLPCPARAIVKGDQLEACISAASILAKTHRDALLCALDLRYPQYGFAIHKGYPTPQHLAALREHGPCPEHRLSFAPVAQAPKQEQLF
jgi:ribonuclease HII